MADSLSLHAQNTLSRQTAHIILEPLNFIAGLAALVPKPRVNFTGSMVCLHRSGN
jgi:hypothetical protein